MAVSTAHVLTIYSLFNTEKASTPAAAAAAAADIDDSQLLVPADLARQPGKPLTGIPTFMHITMLDERHLTMTYFPINSPPLKPQTLLRQVCLALFATI